MKKLYCQRIITCVLRTRIRDTSTALQEPKVGASGKKTKAAEAIEADPKTLEQTAPRSSKTSLSHL